MMKDTAQRISGYSLSMLFTLYLAQGLPTGFMTQALPTLLRHYGVSLTQIGISGLLMLPWALKFLWAPYVDRYGHQRIGHYRSWIVVTQTLMIMCLLTMAFLPIENLGNISGLWGLFIVLFVMNTLCATQDIATDGLAVNILKQGAVHWGNTFQVMGSRLGFIIGGGGVLYLIDQLTWQTTFLLLAAGVFLNSFLILAYKEPTFKDRAILSLAHTQSKNTLQKIINIYGHLWASKELRIWMIVVLTYKIADGIASPILKPMMVDVGLSLSEIGIYVTMVGASCAVVGALIAGAMIKIFSLKLMFLVFSVLQILSFIYYIFIANAFEQVGAVAHFHFYIANAIEECIAAMSLVTMLSLIMKYSRPQYAATDFTVQVALMSIVGGSLYILGGILADYFGYSVVLYMVVFMAIFSFFNKLYWFYMTKYE